MTPDLSLATQLDLALRLTVGLVLGALIGFERELHRQPAGFRTHSLVSLGAALFTVVSAFGFGGDMVDPTRIAAQIVSGIGFIGAGTILQYRGHIRGLTTAASLWSVAAIGTGRPRSARSPSRTAAPSCHRASRSGGRGSSSPACSNEPP